MVDIPKLQTSAEILDYLNRKSFSTLTRGDQVYTSEEATQLPEIYPMLLLAIRRFVSSFHEEPIIVDIDPGLGITLQQLSMDKITPSSFISFGKKLNYGDFLIHSFSPTKEFNWYQASDLLEQIGEEMDSVISDMSKQTTWQEQKYDILVKLIAEKANLVNDALHNSTFTTLQFGKPQKYKEIDHFIAKLKLDYDKAPLMVSLIIPDEKQDNEKFLSIFNTIETVLQVAIEPIYQLNEESLRTAEKMALSRYLEKLVIRIANKGTFVPLTEINEVIESLPTIEGPLNPEKVKKYMKRYFGTITARILVKQYLDLLAREVNDVKVIDELEAFLTLDLQRKYFLGIISKFNYKDNLLSGLPSLLKEFAMEKKLESVKRESINNATIKIANELMAAPEKLEIPSIGIQSTKNDFCQSILQQTVEITINKQVGESLQDYLKIFQDFLSTSIQPTDELICSETEYERTKEETIIAIESIIPKFLHLLKKEYYNGNIQYLFSPIFFETGIFASDELNGFPRGDVFLFFDEFINRWKDSSAEQQDDLLRKILRDHFETSSFELTIRITEYIQFMDYIKTTIESELQDFARSLRDEIRQIQIDWSHHYNDLQNFLEFWFKDFSGLVPDEITLRLNTGILYLNIDYIEKLSFAAYIEKDEDGPIDFGRLREKGRLMMEAYSDGFETQEFLDSSEIIED
ncbi:MAG: hypothetical protein ACXAEU_06505 [Candidatus Hodarchaeales archaeon]|jgi:hypothetical protein